MPPGLRILVVGAPATASASAVATNVNFKKLINIKCFHLYFLRRGRNNSTVF